MNRRTFLRRTALAGTVGLGLTGWRPSHAVAEPQPETTRLRLIRVPGICVAPEYIAEELLRAEGFTDLQYVKRQDSGAKAEALAAGEADLTLNYAGPLIVNVDASAPIVILAGVHVGCFELFGSDRVHTIRDLKSKTVAVSGVGAADHIFLSSMLAHVGVDPRKDVQWVTYPSRKSVELLADGKIDALLGFPPISQEVRTRKIGHVVVNSSADRPWSQYFCCLAVGHREFVRQNPVATKRAVRALLKAADVCAQEPERAARIIVDRGYVERYDYALQTMKETPYNRWRTYDPEDTIRFYALRLHEAGMIKSSPQKIIAQGTDWRFLSELKKELKG